RHAHRWADAVARDLRNDSALGRATGKGRRSPQPRHHELWAMSHDDLQVAARGTTGRGHGAHGAKTPGAQAGAGPAPEAAGPGVDEGESPGAVWVRLWPVDAADRGRADRAEIRRAAGGDGGRAAARRVGHHAAETVAARLRARSRRDQALDDD